MSYGRQAFNFPVMFQAVQQQCQHKIVTIITHVVVLLCCCAKQSVIKLWRFIVEILTAACKPPRRCLSLSFWVAFVMPLLILT